MADFINKIKKRLMAGKENSKKRSFYRRDNGLPKNQKRVLIVIAAILLIMLARFLYTVYEDGKTYDEYSVEKEISIADGAGSSYVAFKDFFVRYGVDGISYMDGDSTVWSQAYEMTNAIVDVCEDYVAVADKGTNLIYVFDDTGLKGQISTGYPIISIEVANQGVVAALLEENTANYIEVYDRNGKALISHKTLINGNGYPLRFSLSDDGTKMVVSYVCVSNGSMESKLMFYNFSDVGQNEQDRMVGGFDFDQTVVPMVKFLNNNVVAAVGDNKVSFYKVKEKPSLISSIEINDEIQKVFYNEDYLGLAFRNKGSEGSYVIKAYDLDGDEVMNQTVNMEFDKIAFSGKNVLVYDDMNCKIISFGGKERFYGHFNETVTSLLPTSSFREYLMITNNNVRRIRIK